MACLSILPIIIILILLFNICYNSNNENINIFLIVFICFFVAYQFINKNKENIDNVESDVNLKTDSDNTINTSDNTDINIESQTESSIESSTESSNKTTTDTNINTTTDTKIKSKVLKYLDTDKKFIDSLINKDRMYIDNLDVKTIDLDFVSNLIYPIGVVIFSWLPLDKLNLPGKWKALPGSRLISTTGKLKYSVSKNQNEKQLKFNDSYSNTYTEYSVDVTNIDTNIDDHKYISPLNTSEFNVKLCANNVMDHKHIVYVNYGRVARAKDDSQHAFALYGNGDDNQKDRCNDNSVSKNQKSFEVFPSRRTVYYTDINDLGTEKDITIDSVKEHSNIPRYVLLYAYERIE